MEIVHYECYVHVNAIMWRVLYRELRAITNDSSLHLNPLEINDVYEEVWNVGVLLRSEEALSILDLDYRPWPKIKEGTEESINFYKVHDRNKQVLPQRLPSSLPVPYMLVFLLTIFVPYPSLRKILRHLEATSHDRTLQPKLPCYEKSWLCLGKLLKNP